MMWRKAPAEKSYLKIGIVRMRQFEARIFSSAERESPDFQACGLRQLTASTDAGGYENIQ
jgi:hypothetical protein